MLLLVVFLGRHVNTATVTEIFTNESVTNPPQCSPYGMSCNNCQQLTDSYYLFQVDMCKGTTNTKHFYCLKFYWRDELGVGADTNCVIGSVAGTIMTITNLPKVLTKIWIGAGPRETIDTPVNNPESPFYGMHFYFSDGSIRKLPDNPTVWEPLTDPAESYYFPATGEFQGRFRGMSLWRDWIIGWCCFRAHEFSVFVDASPCSNTYVPVQTIPTMTIITGGTASTLDLTFLNTNTIATAQGNPSLCGTTYSMTITPTRPFSLSIVNGILTGSNTDPLNNGSYIQTITVCLATKCSDPMSMTVVVQTNPDPPVITPTSVIFEPGVVTQPAAATSFTLTANTQAAGVLASLVSVTPIQPFTLTLNPNTSTGGSIQVNGVTISHAGTYTVVIKTGVGLTDSVNIVVQDPCKRAIFELTPNPFSAQTINVPSGSSVNVPFHVFTDLERSYGILCSYSASFTTAPTYVTTATPYTDYVVNAPSISLPTEIGTHAVTIKIVSVLFPLNVSPASYNFNVNVSCLTTGLTINTSVTDFSYALLSGNVIKGVYSVTQTAACGLSVTYSVEHLVNGVSQGTVSNFNSATGQYTFNFSDPSSVGTVQTYKLTASVLNPISGPASTTNTLNINIIIDCNLATFIDKTFNNMTIKVAQTATQDITFWDNFGQGQSNYALCGPRTYTFTPTLPAYLSIDAGLTTLTLTTSNPADVGIYSFSFVVKLLNYAAVPGLTKNFQVTITCEVFTLAFTTSPANMFVEPGVTIQPANSPFVVSQVPNCNTATTFSFTSGPPAPISLQNILNLQGNVQCLGATIAQQGVYPLTLRAVVDAQTIDVNFTVEISDPCKRAVINAAATPPLVPMTATRFFDTTVTQTSNIKTDLTPSGISCALTCSLVSPPAYVSLSGYTLVVDISQTTEANGGTTTTVSVICDSATYPTLVADRILTFDVTINHCVVNTMTIPTNAAVTHAINDPPLPIVFAAATWSNLLCLYQVTYTLTFELNTAPISQPSFITFTDATRTITASATQPSHTGVYNVIITATIPQPSLGAGGTKVVTTNFALTVTNDCASTSLNDITVANMTVKVTLTTSQPVAFSDSKEVSYGIPGYCGLRVYTFTGGQPAFLIIDGSQTTLTLTTNLVPDVGVYNVQFTVTLQNYPTVIGITKNFVVTITCEVFTLVYSTLPANMFIETGVTTQPATVPFNVVRTPDCLNTVTFTFVAAPPAFVSLTGLAATLGNVQVNGAVLADQGLYPLTLRAAVDLQLINAPFTVEISDPCKRAIFQPLAPSPIADMVLIRDFDPTLTQTFTIVTDVQQNYALVCAFVAALVTPPQFVSLSATTISVDPLLTVVTDVAVHTISVLVNSALYPTTVLSKTYTFLLDVQHCSVSSFTIPAIASASMLINDPSLPVTFSPAVISSLACQYTITYTDSYLFNTAVTTRPSFVAFDNSGLSFGFSPTLPAQCGVYDITVTATIPDPFVGPTATKVIATTFTLTIDKDCPSTLLIDMPINDMAVKITLTQTQGINFLDSKAVEYVITDYCGPRVIAFNPSMPAFLSMDAALTVLTLTTNLVPDVGVYNVQFTVTLQNYPTVIGITKNFVVTITCEVFTLVYSTLPANMFIETGVTTQPATVPFNVVRTPDCLNTVTFTFVAAPPAFVSLTGLAATLGNVQVNGAVLADQGLYPLTLRAAVDLQQINAPFTVEISDPCKRAIFQPLAPSPIADMVLIRDFDPTLTQTFTIVTDVQQNYALVCAFVVALVTPPQFVSLSATTISVDPLLTVVTDVAVHTISVLVNSALYPTTVLSKTYTFLLDVQHCIVNTLTIGQLANQVFTLNDPPLSLTLTSAWSNLICLYTQSYSTVGVPDASPLWLNLNSATGSIIINGCTFSDVGIHQITATVTIPAPWDPSGVKQTSMIFQVEILDPCTWTVLIDNPLVFMETQVSKLVSFDFTFPDDVSTGFGLPDFCGARVYEFVPALNAITMNNSILQLYPMMPIEAGTFKVALKVSMANYPYIILEKLIDITITCQVFSIKVASSPKPTTYTIAKDTVVEVPFLFQESPACGLKVTLQPALAFVKVNLAQTSLTVETIDPLSAGVHNIQLIATPTAVNQPDMTATAPFDLTVVDFCGTTTMNQDASIRNIELFVPNTKASMAFNFSYSAAILHGMNCGPIVIKVVNDDTDNQVSWAQLDKTRLNIDVGSFAGGFSKKLRVEAFLQDFPLAKVEQFFNVTLSQLDITCKTYPAVNYLAGSGGIDLILDYTNSTKTGSPVTASITPQWLTDTSQPLSWPGSLSFDQETNTFSFMTDDPNDSGTFRVGLKIKYLEYQEYQWSCTRQITISAIQRSTSGGAEEEKQTILPEDYAEEQRSKFKQLNALGKFDYSLPRVEAKIVSIDNYGKAQIEFNRDIDVVPSLELINYGTIYLDEVGSVYNRRSMAKTFAKQRVKVPILDAKIIASGYTDPQNLNFTWNVTKMNNRTMDLQFYFETPEYISQSVKPEELEISFNDPLMFMSIEGLILSEEGTKIKKRLPQQMKMSESQAVMAQAMESVTDVLANLMPGNLAVSVFMSGALNVLLGLVEVQQLVLVYSMMKIKFPPNAQAFFNVIVQIAAFDFFDTEDTINGFLKIEHVDPYDLRFADLGFQSGMFLNNLGTQLFIFLALFAAIIALKLLKSLRIKRIHKTITKAYSFVRTLLIGTLIESYAIISLSCLLAQKSVSFKSVGEIIQTASALLSFVVLLLLLVPLFYLLKYWDYSQSSNQMRKRFNVFLRDLDASKGSTVVKWPLYFIMRRLVLTLAIVWLDALLVVQFEIMAFNIIFVIMLIIETKPFEEPQRSFITLCNEVFTMFVLYHFMCFTPWIPEPETRLIMGTSFCAFESANLILNLGYVFVIQFQEGLYKYRLWRLKKQRLEQAKRGKHLQLKKSAKNYAERRKKFKVPFSISNQAPELTSNLGNEQLENEAIKQTYGHSKQSKPKLSILKKETKLSKIEEVSKEEFDLENVDKHFQDVFDNQQISSCPQESLTYPINVIHEGTQTYMMHLRAMEEEEKKYYKGSHSEHKDNSRNRIAIGKPSQRFDNNYGLLDEPGSMNFEFKTFKPHGRSGFNNESRLKLDERRQTAQSQGLNHEENQPQIDDEWLYERRKLDLIEQKYREFETRNLQFKMSQEASRIEAINAWNEGIKVEDKIPTKQNKIKNHFDIQPDRRRL